MRPPRQEVHADLIDGIAAMFGIYRERNLRAGKPRGKPKHAFNGW